MLGFIDYLIIGGGIAIAAFLLFNMIREGLVKKTE